MFLCLSVTAYSQKIKLIEGDVSVLKGQKSVTTEFTYDDMSVGKFPKEADYVAQKKKDLNAKETGRGDKWEQTWVSDRKERFEPQFRELFSKYAEISTVGETVPYTLIFKTVKTEPGWNIGISRAPAFIDADVSTRQSTQPGGPGSGCACGMRRVPSIAGSGPTRSRCRR